MKQNSRVTTVLGFILFLLVQVSCTPMEDITYLGNALPEAEYKYSYQEEYRIQTDDNLYIQVLSPEEKTSSFFNTTLGGNYISSDAAIELSSYRADQQGFIDFPFIGRVEVGGKTISEVKNHIEQEVKKYVAESSVIVKLVNRHVAVLGEVESPGQYSIYNNDLNILEAISLAKDLTDYGNRKRVKLIRKEGNEIKVHILDLTDQSLLTSPYYNLMPNDLIYVEPAKQITTSKVLPTSTVISVTLTSISTAILIYSSFFK